MDSFQPKPAIRPIRRWYMYHIRRLGGLAFSVMFFLNKGVKQKLLPGCRANVGGSCAHVSFFFFSFLLLSLVENGGVRNLPEILWWGGCWSFTCVVSRYVCANDQLFPPRPIPAWTERLQKCTCHVYNNKPGQLFAVPGVAIQVKIRVPA